MAYCPRYSWPSESGSSIISPSTSLRTFPSSDKPPSRSWESLGDWGLGNVSAFDDDAIDLLSEEVDSGLVF